MATEVQTPTRAEPSVTSLIAGILSDIQDLFKQQLRLTREEIESDLRKSKAAASLFAAGYTVCLIGMFAVCLTLAHLLYWLAAPAGTDPASFPLWGCYAVVSSLFLAVGGIMMLAGKRKLDDAGTPLHETARALKENIEWKTTTKKF